MPGSPKSTRQTQFLSSLGLESIAGLCHKIWVPQYLLREEPSSSLSPCALPCRVLPRSESHPLPAPETVPGPRLGRRTAVHPQSSDRLTNPWSCPESLRSFWNTVSLADILSQDKGEWAGKVEVPVCRDQALQGLSVPLTGTASPPPACHLLLAGPLGTLLGASRGVCLNWKGAGTGWSGAGGSGNFPNLRWPGSCPLHPKGPAPWLVCWSWRRESGQLLVVWRPAAGWEPAFLTLSGAQGGPYCITLGASAPALQPAGPLEEGLSLFFKKPLTISSS